MAFTGLPEPGVEVDQPALVEEACCDGGSGFSATTTTTKDEESVVTTVLPEQHDTVPKPDHHHEDAAAPEQLATEVSASETKPVQLAAEVLASETKPEEEEEEKPPASDEPEEKQSPPEASKEEGERNNNKAPAADDYRQESTRELLKRHRMEVAGRVWVPEKWGQEVLLKDWVDCTVFDRPLVPARLLTARRALVAESWTRHPDRTSTVSSSSTGSSPLRVQNLFNN